MEKAASQRLKIVNKKTFAYVSYIPQKKEAQLTGTVARLFLGGFTALCLGACSPDNPKSPDQYVRIVDADLSSFGACVFQQMNRVWPLEVHTERRSDGVVMVVYETLGPFAGLTIRPMEVTAKKISATKTEVRTRVLASEQRAWTLTERCVEPRVNQTAGAIGYLVRGGRRDAVS
ncbi:hypothetical protein [Bosea sp. BK604]|uniref:hypothetical protein n=1 Tax=Bosea sp. BK604 TaxID=2512180 RepID=UPI00105235E9|nr:hypothetical protein [Bosea sp. BK604]TCR69680.1 hypothetical protein EV560_10177 [Bosea sp. BK604]